MASLWVARDPGAVVRGVHRHGARRVLHVARQHTGTRVDHLRIPREIRTQALASFGVFQCIGAPIGLLLAGPALARYDTHSVLAAVLALMTVAAATFVVAALS